MNLLDRAVNADRHHDDFVYIAALIASLNGLLFGYDTGVISGALIYIENSFALSTFLQEVVTAAVLVGAMVGAMTGGRIADRIGRRRLTLLGAGVFFVSSLSLAAAQSVAWLVVGRFVLGIGVGLASIVGPLYISEIAPRDVRGSLGFLQQLMITIGIMIAYFTNYLFAPSLFGITGWRLMLGFGAVPAVLLGGAMYTLPETPRWLVDHDRHEEVRDVLSRFRREEDFEEEIEAIEKNSRAEGESSFSDLLEPWIRPALVLGVVLAFFQQLVGINSVIYYAPTILTNIGLADSASLIGTVGIGVLNVVVTVIAVVLADRLGRRLLLLIGTAGMAIMLAIIGIGFRLPGLSGIIGYVTLGGMLLYVAFYAISLGPVFWVLISEIYPQRLRGTATGVATFFEWTGNLIVSLTFLSIIDSFGQTVGFWGLGVISLAAFVYIYFRVPETMGRSLESIEADLRQNALGDADTEVDVGDVGESD